MIEMILYSLFAPFGLLLLTLVWAYPAVLEEVVKWAILKFGDSSNVGFRTGVYVGLSFGVSEAILYCMNAWVSAQWGVIVLRLLLTVPMHVVTAGFIGWSIKHNYGYLGLILSMVIHATFNYVASLIV